MKSETASVLKEARSATLLKETHIVGNTTLIRVGHRMVEKIAQLLEGQADGCIGFVLHHSYTEAMTYTSRFEAGFASNFNVPLINNKKTTEAMIQFVNATRMVSFVTLLENDFKNRFYLSTHGFEASDWLEAQWNDITSERNDIFIEPYLHRMYGQHSILATISGSRQNNEIIILGAHLDSINIKYRPYQTLTKHDIENMPAPGADDNGSGLAVLTEVLRSIVMAGYKPETTIHLIGFAIEEIGLVGSREIASAYHKQGRNVVGMLNFDMVGYKGEDYVDVCISSDKLSNHDQSLFLVSLMNQYLPHLNYRFFGCRYACSDHASWTENNFPATMVHECPSISPYMHKDSDLVKNINADYMSNFARLGISYVSELAKGCFR